MTTIPQVAATMQRVLQEEADRAGLQSGFVKRSDAKLTGSSFTQTLVFGLGANPQASLAALTQTAAALGVTISAEALHQRFTRAAASCLEQVLCRAIQCVVASDPVMLPILERFSQVVASDSTTIALPEALRDVWQGCGNGTPHAGNAAIKLQVALDLCTGQLRGPSLHDGREGDRLASIDHDLPAGAVRLVDLGYWDLTAMASCKERGVYWFSRMQALTALQTADGRWWSLLQFLTSQSEDKLDLPVRVGREAQVEARLLALRVPHAVAAERQRRLRAEAQEKGEKVSEVRLALAGWTILITTIPPELLSLEEAVVLARGRWQIELLFKLWKSHGQIDLVRDVQPWRVLCELYGRLLSQIVQHWLLLVSGWEEPERSLPKAAQTIRTHWLVLAMALRHKQRLVEAITTLARCIRAGCKKTRRKKHPNTYQHFLASAESCVT